MDAPLCIRPVCYSSDTANDRNKNQSKQNNDCQDRDCFTAWINQLRGFQGQVRAQVLPVDPNLADVLLDYARERNFKGIVTLQGDSALTLARDYLPTAILLVYSFCQRDEFGDIVYSFTWQNFSRAFDWRYLRILFRSTGYAPTLARTVSVTCQLTRGAFAGMRP